MGSASQQDSLSEDRCKFGKGAQVLDGPKEWAPLCVFPTRFSAAYHSRVYKKQSLEGPTPSQRQPALVSHKEVGKIKPQTLPNALGAALPDPVFCRGLTHCSLQNNESQGPVGLGLLHLSAFHLETHNPWPHTRHSGKLGSNTASLSKHFWNSSSGCSHSFLGTQGFWKHALESRSSAALETLSHAPFWLFLLNHRQGGQPTCAVWGI